VINYTVAQFQQVHHGSLTNKTIQIKHFVIISISVAGKFSNKELVLPAFFPRLFNTKKLSIGGHPEQRAIAAYEKSDKKWLPAVSIGLLLTLISADY
jgi:hypothetical protein